MSRTTRGTASAAATIAAIAVTAANAATTATRAPTTASTFAAPADTLKSRKRRIISYHDYGLSEGEDGDDEPDMVVPVSVLYYYDTDPPNSVAHVADLYCPVRQQPRKSLTQLDDHHYHYADKNDILAELNEYGIGVGSITSYMIDKPDRRGVITPSTHLWVRIAPDEDVPICGTLDGGDMNYSVTLRLERETVSPIYKMSVKTIADAMNRANAWDGLRKQKKSVQQCEETMGIAASTHIDDANMIKYWQANRSAFGTAANTQILVVRAAVMKSKVAGTGVLY